MEPFGPERAAFLVRPLKEKKQYQVAHADLFFTKLHLWNCAPGNHLQDLEVNTKMFIFWIKLISLNLCFLLQVL